MHAGEVHREVLWRENKERLAELAWRALHVKHLDHPSFFVICIDVDDPNWKDLVDTLMPGHDWQAYRDRNELPCARGSVMRDTVGEYIARTVPVLADALLNPEPSTLVQAVILGAGGASMYLVEPKVDAS